MNPATIIAKKRDGGELSSVELRFLVQGYVEGRIPDYQISAFLMAVYFQGMTFEESATLTEIMRDSGAVLNFTAIDGFKADKHSTGGVGDKVSLILAPLVASAGLIVPMISGRALAHTGGTLDKLEAIPGFRTNLNLTELKNQLEKIGVALIGQSEDLCPADKRIYALRDATGTVNSIPLITASILSKKLAEGIDALVLDVKAGNGAIFDKREKAWELARMLVKTAQRFNLKTAAFITSMDQPLGRAVGNWLETKEAIETLKGEGPPDLVEITLTLGAQMLVMGGGAENITQGKALLVERLNSGQAFEKFLKIVESQGGDCAMVEHPHKYEKAKYVVEIPSPKSGFVSHLHAREIGAISMELGAGRHAVTDGVDYTSGILLQKKGGDPVSEGEILACAFCNKKELLEPAKDRIQKAFEIVDQKTNPAPLIYSLMDSSGETRFELSKA
jgi:pyrimidine-nucleoside phosphorylase